MSFPFGRVDLQGAETPEDVRKTRYRLIVGKPFKWVSDVEPVKAVSVPSGFETDGGSVPRLLWRVFGGPNGPLRDAYIVHDLLYSQAKINRRTRKQADLVLKEIALELGSEGWRAQALYIGVRLGGRRAWLNHAKRNTQYHNK